MKLRALFVILLLTNGLAHGQSEEFGNISLKELSGETFSSDTSSAIILFDVGSLELEPNSVAASTQKRHTRIKILNEQAFKTWGNQEFYIYKEANLKIKGATYNLENGIIKKSELEQSSINRTDFDKEIQLITVAFPNVKVGSVIEMSYVTKYIDYYDPDWQFQHTIPTVRSEYTVSIPAKNIKYNLRGFLTPALHEEKYEGSYHHWVLKDIPAFVEEPMMPDANMYSSKVVFAGKSDWKDQYFALLRSPYFAGVLNSSKSITPIVNEITAGMTDDRQKVRAISEYIKKHVEFNNRYHYLGSDPMELLEKKKGNSGEINLLFGSMLQKAGLKVNMVLLSTRGNGIIDQKTPGLWQFNYVICEVVTKDGDLLVDATDKLLPFDVLPRRCNNQFGFFVGDSEFGWVPIQFKHRSKVLIDAIVTFTESGGLTGKVKAFKDGYAAHDLRVQYKTDNGDYKVDLGNKLWNIENYAIKNVAIVDKPVEETCDVSIDEYVIRANDRIYFNPHLFLREESNPFVANSRMYPIDFDNLIDNTVVCTLVIPEGYIVEELPENKAIALPGNAAKCTFSTTVNGNKIMVMSKLIFNQSFFMPEEYASLKEFYGKLVAKKSENIVLKKK